MRYRDAEDAYRRALTIHVKAFGAHSAVLITILTGLAELYEEQMNYDPAEAMLTRAVAICEKAFAENSDCTGDLSPVEKLASLYRTQKRYHDLELTYNRELAAREKSLGAMHSAVVSILNGLGKVYQQQKKYRQAEAVFRRAIAVNQKAIAELGHTSLLDPEDKSLLLLDSDNRISSLLDAADKLSLLYESQNRISDAERTYQRALVVIENGLGPKHPGVEEALEGLGSFYEFYKKYGEAEHQYRRVVAFRERELAENIEGATYEKVVDAFDMLSGVLQKQNRHREAEDIYKRAIAAVEAALVDKSDGSLLERRVRLFRSLAALKEREGNYGEAENYLLHTISLREEENDNATSYKGQDEGEDPLIVLYKMFGRFHEAMNIKKRLSAIDRRGLSKQGPGERNESTTVGDQNDNKADDCEGLPGFSASQTQQSDTIEARLRRRSALERNCSVLSIISLFRSAGHLEEVEGYLKQKLDEENGGDDGNVYNIVEALIDIYKSGARLTEAESLLRNVAGRAAITDIAIDLRLSQGRLDEAKELVKAMKHPISDKAFLSFANFYQSHGMRRDLETLIKQRIAEMLEAAEAPAGEGPRRYPKRRVSGFFPVEKAVIDALMYFYCGMLNLQIGRFDEADKNFKMIPTKDFDFVVDAMIADRAAKSQAIQTLRLRPRVEH